MAGALYPLFAGLGFAFWALIVLAVLPLYAELYSDLLPRWGREARPGA
jgi:hypothetical protein